MPHFREGVRIIVTADVLILRVPRLSAVFTAETARCRDAHPKAVGVLGVYEDGMQAEPPVAWLPFFSGGMFVERKIGHPGIAIVFTHPELGRFGAQIKNAGLDGNSRAEMPELLYGLVWIPRSGALFP
jgi:hypothetical protein